MREAADRADKKSPSNGRLPPGTVIKIINLPAEMRDALETFRIGAANEVAGVRKEKAPRT